MQPGCWGIQTGDHSCQIQTWLIFDYAIWLIFPHQVAIDDLGEFDILLFYAEIEHMDTPQETPRQIVIRKIKRKNEWGSATLLASAAFKSEVLKSRMLGCFTSLVRAIPISRIRQWNSQGRQDHLSLTSAEKLCRRIIGKYLFKFVFTWWRCSVKFPSAHRLHCRWQVSSSNIIACLRIRYHTQFLFVRYA